MRFTIDPSTTGRHQAVSWRCSTLVYAFQISRHAGVRFDLEQECGY